MICQGCTNRTPGCHSTCEGYQAFKDEQERIKAATKPKKDAEHNMNAYKIEVFEKYRRRIKKK